MVHTRAIGSPPALAARLRFPSGRMVWGVLIGLMVVGGFLRFWRLGHQAYWTDEAYTVGRIKGSFDYLMARLSDQGFPPGWYVLLRGWALLVEKVSGNGAFAFSAGVLRTLPAVFGTLTIPAMYFLGRQFTDRRGALLVTLLAAVNPFLIYYARDIKMYAPLVFFAVINTALFLRWQQTQRHWVYFPLYVVSGLCLTATHSMGWFLIVLQLLYLFGRPRLKALDGPLWALGVALFAVLPLFWYLGKNHYMEKIADRGADSSLLWITRYTDMSWKTIASLPSEQLLGFLWPVYPPDARLIDWFSLGADFNKHLATRSWAWMARGEWWCVVGLLAVLLGGLIPWRRLRRRKAAAEGVVEEEVAAEEEAPGWKGWWFVALWIIVPTACLALTWIPEKSWWHGVVWGHLKPQPVWEPRYLSIVAPALILWLGAALRRLPLVWVRGLAIGVVAGVSIISALSNQLIYRNAPFQRAARIAARYAPPGAVDFSAVAIGNPEVSFLGEIDAVAYPLALHQRPSMKEQVSPTRNGSYWKLGAVPSGRELPDDDPARVVRFLRLARVTPEVRTIVLTDRDGDLAAADDPLSTAALQKVLGPGWKLVDTERYRWHYEWRFYLFSTWRTRAWERVKE